MSLRGTKRASGVRGEEPSTSKRRRPDPEDWQLRPVSDLKMSSIYNRSAPEAPAELFRKDLISAMKLPDNEPLTPSEYWVITDAWKQDWERGVQVPVNPDSLPAPKVKIIDNPQPPEQPAFKLPKDKYVHLNRDVHYSSEQHLLSSTPACAEAACGYDLDATDTCWLKLFNAERARAGAPPVTETQLEKVIEELELRTWEKIQAIMKSEEGLGIEYDENVICDVCRSPDSEDGNEMVFCDSCNICVHQACYGITVIPDGQWLCRPCGDSVRPTCVLCPNLGGAMKCTPSGHKWAHVSCVLWIPEVSIGCAEKMEPITKISSIPASRWSLVCVLCRERKGACIQCSVKSCKTAYHVTCAFKHGLEMRAIIEDENADDGVKLRSYCQKHSVNSKKEKSSGSGSEEEEVKRKRRKDMTSEEKTQARAARLQEFEKEFEKHVSVKDISSHLLDVDQDAINYIYHFWKLKRRAGHNRPLLPPKSDDNELLSHRQEQADLDKMKMFVQLRQDLERVRNLCYMVSRREKLSRSFFRMREQTFHKQVVVLSAGEDIPADEMNAIIEANHGPSIYDKLYSHPDAADHKSDFAELLARIAPPGCSDDKTKKDRNGLRRSKSSNPYRKHYVNGSRRSGSMYSGLSSEESDTEMARPSTSKYRARAIGSSSEEEPQPSTSKKKPSTSPKKKVSPKAKGKRSPRKIERKPEKSNDKKRERTPEKKNDKSNESKIDKKKKKIPQSKAVVDSSSEDEPALTRPKKDASKTLRQMEKEMAAGRLGQSGTDSDDLMPIRTTRSSKFPVDIYSDSSEDSSTDRRDSKRHGDQDKLKSPSSNDPQQSLPRTKAAMKEFIPSHSEKKDQSNSAEDKPGPKKRGRKPSNKDKKTPVKTNESDDEAKNKENKFSKQKDNPTDLIVPQRQAAKKASENMRSTSTGKKEETSTETRATAEKSSEEVKQPKLKGKGKGKEIKSPSAKTTRKSSKDADKETIAYVPQRQAAKKAAAHIKSIGSKGPVPEADTAKKKDDKPESSKSPQEDDKKKSDDKDSSSSSSNSSSSSYSSSSSSEEEVEPEKTGPKPAAKAREIKPAVKQPSVFSPPGTRPTVDLPFLDKVSRPLSSTSASSDSESTQSERSGSSSPSPKRPRRRRKRKSDASNDSTSPRKAPDKKLKTSERESERRVPSPIAEREEPSRADDACAATRSRTRSITASGSLPHIPDAGSRKPSKDDSSHSPGPNKTPKESRQSGELPTPERKTNAETVKARRKSSYAIETDTIKEEPGLINDIEEKSVKVKRPSVSADESMKLSETESPSVSKPSPRKPVETRRKSISSRRMSVKEPPQKHVKEQHDSPKEVESKPIKQRRQSRYEAHNTHSSRDEKRGHSSPVRKHNTTVETPPEEKKSPIRINDDYNDTEKWLPKPPSPTHVLTPIERPGGNEKYMTDDKSFDSSDCTEKTSVKMLAKIQANLNENTMIKSPRTPMDARSLNMDGDDHLIRNVKKRSTLDTITQDASHVQGVEISKSAKIPSNLYHNRSMCSPQQKDNELFAFDMLAVDDGFNHDEMMKPFASYPEFFFKEDSKEQGAQETLNLVDRLRMQLSSKKAPAENSSQDQAAVSGDEKDQRDDEINANLGHDKEDRDMSPVRELNQEPEPEPHIMETPKHVHNTADHVQHSIAPADMPCRKSLLDSKEYHMPMQMSNEEKWAHESLRHVDPPMDPIDDRKYEHNVYNDDMKEPATVQSDMQSASEVGDTTSLSKQSDDSQPSVVDNSQSNDVELNQDTHNYDNNNSVIHSDCATISSPYIGQEKWRESKITTRRSSASSTNSEGSIIAQGRSALKSHMNACEPHSVAVMPEIDSYPPIPAYSCPVEPSMPLNQYATYPPSASPFLSSMGSLFAAGACSQLPLPSPGSIYGSSMAYPPTPMMPSKPSFPLCAAFTSSSQNIALTTAMIAPPTPKLDSPRDDTIDVTGSDKFSIHVASSPSISVDSYETSRATKISNDSNETMMSMSHQESKSPPKPPMKAHTKFPGKSPGKSPGISPRQSDAPKGSKRSSNKGNRGQRGRGRSKSRAQVAHAFPPDYMGTSIQNKLVGTVYDFEEEIANDGVDLKSLRERRKSIDVRDDRRSDHSFKDISQSPHVQSPQSKKTPSDVRDGSNKPVLEQRVESPVSFSHVAPVLPGPVDMRTYQPAEAPAPPVFHSQLLAYSAVDRSTEIDEDKRLPVNHVPTPPLAPTPAPPPVEVYTPHLPKVSLSDSRNQLKVKIKGPFLDANYSSSVTPVVPPPAPVHETPVNFMAASNVMSGSTNLRRMRKKELLRQYWTQDMNMDDPTAGIVGVVPPPAAPSPLTRAVITIPKAVASMTSIPTREDYKIVDAPIEKKKRKVSSGLSRELRHLKVTMNDDVDPADDVKLSALAVPPAHKRRGRISTKPARPNVTSPVAPKLKIKIGANIVQQVNDEPSDFRPPKKRLIHKPSFKDLRRESMKYRKMVMADFEENEKTDKHKSSKSEKRKKKKDKKVDKLQVISESESAAPKLIIKIKRPVEESEASGGAAAAAAAAAAAPEPAVDPLEYDPTAPDPLAIDHDPPSNDATAPRKVRTAKVTPIRLKLARTAGSSYVMKESASPEQAAPPAPAPDEHSDVR